MKNYKLFILTPATMRMEVLKQTLDSFSKNMFPKLIDRKYMIGGKKEKRIDVEMVLNVDFVGDTSAGYDDYELSNLAGEYFFISSCKYKLDHCSLASSFHWLWKTAAESYADYIFYLEDDWLLLEEVDLFDMIDVMEDYPDLATLRLPFRETGLGFSKNWSHFFPWNGRFFICDQKDKKNIGWCGHPSLVRIDFVRETFPLLSNKICPEVQMKGLYPNEMKNIILKWNYGVFGIPSGPIYVKDIGRDWRNEKAISKNLNTSWTHRNKQPNDNR